MYLREFIKKESVYLKVLYAIGCFLFLYHLNEITNERNEVHWIYPILSILILLIYIIRVVFFYKKNNLF